MRGTLSSSPLAVVLILVSNLATAGPEPPRIIGEHLRDVVLETPHPYPAASGLEPELVWSEDYSYPDARYLVFEFRQFELAPGDRVEVRDPKGGQVQVYRGRGPRDRGGDFITKMIQGSEAVIELYSRNPVHAGYGYRIERVTRGYDDFELAALEAGPEAICGGSDQEDAVCYENLFPEVYERARPVARIVMDGLALCTAWLVSCDNHLITNNHCTWDDTNFDTQGELDRMEFQFGYQDTICGGAEASIEHSFLGGTFLENDRNLDYTLFRAPAGEDPAATYGWLTLDLRLPDLDEPVYLPGHPGGRPKEIALYSTEAADQDNPDGFCEIFSTDEPVCIGGTTPEIGYLCDTEGGSDGSPVLSMSTHRVVALHHCANCPNRGVRIQEIWDRNQAGPNPLPICSLYDQVGSMELDRGRYGCADTIAIDVNDASLEGVGSTDVILWSDTEPAPEAATLVEMPPGSGRFSGTFATTAAAPAGDGLLSVADSDGITVRYLDADDGQGGTNVPRDVTVQADCIPPILTNVAPDLYGSLATIRWTTDEPADSRVHHRASSPDWLSTADGSLVTAHAVEVTGLAECTDHLFWVESTDEAGNSSLHDNGGAYHGFTTSVDVIPTLGSGDTPSSITDLADTISTIPVTEDALVVDLEVTVNITHTYVDDLDLYLKGPNGVEILLSSDNGGAGQDLVGTVFDDEAPTSITAGSAPFSGPFRPEQPLSTFHGLAAAGPWSLRVFDDAAGDTGTLDSWTLTLTLPPRPCGPHARYESHALDGDLCILGGDGNADGIWDSGEEVRFQVALENDGRDPLTTVQAAVSPLTAGVTVIDGGAAYGDLAPGVTANPAAPFVMHLPESLACGAELEFRIDIVSTEGWWNGTFRQVAGVVVPAGGTVLDESFDLLGIPPSWTVIDGGGTPDTWFADDAGDPLGCFSTNPNPPVDGRWAAVDSDCAGVVAMDESLVTPALDLSVAQTVTLEFDHYLRRVGTETTQVDVRSSLTGGGWDTVKDWTASTPNPFHETIDITAQAAGAASVEIRWHYYDANLDWYWYLDNVRVSYTAAAGCYGSPCATGSPPAEQTGMHWLGIGTYAWNMDPLATAGYTLHRGSGADLPGLTSAAGDSCLRFDGNGPTDNVADVSADVPVLGGFHWYLVTGWNGVGEGSPGAGTPGLRIVNPTGSCSP